MVVRCTNFGYPIRPRDRGLRLPCCVEVEPRSQTCHSSDLTDIHAGTASRPHAPRAPTCTTSSSAVSFSLITHPRAHNCFLVHPCKHAYAHTTPVCVPVCAHHHHTLSPAHHHTLSPTRGLAHARTPDAGIMYAYALYSNLLKVQFKLTQEQTDLISTLTLVGCNFGVHIGWLYHKCGRHGPMVRTSSAAPTTD